MAIAGSGCPSACQRAGLPVARLLARQGLEGEGAFLMVVTVWAVFAGAALLSIGAGPALGAVAALAACF